MKISTPTLKAISVGILILICLIPTLFVFAVVSDRKVRDQEVREQIGSDWGAPQDFVGPILTVPYKKTTIVDGKNVVSAGEMYLFPDNYELSINLDPSEKVRGIFRIPVYRSTINGSASFPQIDTYSIDSRGITYEYDRAFVSFPFSDARSIEPSSNVLINSKDTQIRSGNGLSQSFTGTRGVHVLAQSVFTEQQVNFTFGLSGNDHLSFVPVGDTSIISISSALGSPSWSGAYLPKDTSVNAQGFSANWEISGLGRAFSNVIYADNSKMISPEQNILLALVETKLFNGIDHYGLVERSIKYAILFIALTFMTFFFIEILKHLRVHPIQYLLIGVALGLFYLLLLSFSEQMQFARAYLLSAAMTIGLIALYAKSVLKAGKHAWSIAFILSSLYAYLYMVLNSEDYALLAGTLLLFGVLSIVMYLTRGVNWYAIGEERTTE